LASNTLLVTTPVPAASCAPAPMPVDMSATVCSTSRLLLTAGSVRLPMSGPAIEGSVGSTCVTVRLKESDPARPENAAWHGPEKGCRVLTRHPPGEKVVDRSTEYAAAPPCFVQLAIEVRLYASVVLDCVTYCRTVYVVLPWRMVRWHGHWLFTTRISAGTATWRSAAGGVKVWARPTLVT